MKDLIEKIKNDNSSEAFLELKAKVENTYYNLYHRKVKKSSATKFEKDNFLESVDQVLLECVYSFDPEKGMAFNTYFFSMSRFKALNLVSKHKSVRAETIDYRIDGDDSGLGDGQEMFEDLPDSKHETEKEIELFSFLDKISRSGILQNEVNSIIFESRIRGDKNSEIIKNLQSKFKFSQETAYKKVKQLNNTLRKYYE